MIGIYERSTLAHSLMKEFIDWTIFLGMHHRDEEIRIRCKNFFVDRITQEASIYMSLENVGKCDDIVWQYPRAIQDAYYPFMDLLHSIMHIERTPYKQEDYLQAAQTRALTSLPFEDLMSIAMAKGNILYTCNPEILRLDLSLIKSPDKSKERTFPPEIEKLYQQSLELKIEILE